MTTSLPAQDGPQAVHIDELSDEQVLALSEADLDRLVRYRMAEEGIKLLPRPAEPELAEVEPPDVTVWEVGGFEFTDKAASEAVAEAVDSQAWYRTDTGYDYSVGGYGDTRHVLPDRDREATVTKKRVYSAEAWDAHKETLREVAEAKKAFREAMAEFDAADRAAQEVRDEVRGRYLEVVATDWRRRGLLARFGEYRELARGDEGIAMGFLRKAYAPSDADLGWLYEQLGWPEGEKDDGVPG